MRLRTRVGASARLAWELPRQRRIPYESPARLAERRDRAVRAAVAHAAAHVPFWREAFRPLPVAARDVRAFEDLARLPLVRRDDVEADPERFRADDADVSQCLEWRSSGTSGTPVTIWYDPGAGMAAAAHMERQRRLLIERVGRRTGYTQAAFMPEQSGSARQGWAYFRAAVLLPDRLHVQHRMIPLGLSLEEQLARLEELRAPVIAGYGSAVERVLLAGGSPGLEVVNFGGDALSAAARAAAEELGVLVLGTYASVEAMRMGWECGNGPLLHLNQDVTPIRLVDSDDRPVATGEPGSVVVSNLVNRASMLLNYVQGDIGAMSPEPCPCGRTLPLMTLLEGRADEFLVLGGHEVHPQSLGGFPKDGVRRFRLVQTVPNRVMVEVEPAPAGDPQEVRRRAELWCMELMDDGAWEVRLVDELAPGPSGKHQVFVGLSQSG